MIFLGSFDKFARTDNRLLSRIPRSAQRQLLDQGRYFLPAFAKRRHMNGECAYAVVQVFPEALFRNGSFNIYIRSRQNSNVDVSWRSAAKTSESAVL